MQGLESQLSSVKADLAKSESALAKKEEELNSIQGQIRDMVQKYVLIRRPVFSHSNMTIDRYFVYSRWHSEKAKEAVESQRLQSDLSEANKVRIKV